MINAIDSTRTHTHLPIRIHIRMSLEGNLQNDQFSNDLFMFLPFFSPFGANANRFLSVKKWLLRKKHQIELARKRGWKGYWVCLKGTTLLFYPCDSREGRTVESAPKHLIIVDGAIMQPIPEHPKRDYIFCLSTAFGDAYLFQAPCQVSASRVDSWITFEFFFLLHSCV